MIRGKVDAQRQAWVQLEIKGGDGHFQSIDAVVDTGFDGHLTLSPELIQGLNLEPKLETNVILATGLREKVNTWSGDVLWHDRLRSMLILEPIGFPLVGMELLESSQLSIQIRVNGDVRIEKLEGN